MKNNFQNYIIAGMTIIIVVLAFYVYDLSNKINENNQSSKLTDLKKSKIEVKKETDEVINSISSKSSETVKKSNLIIKKINHEVPKIIDTTDARMLEFIRGYRPE